MAIGINTNIPSLITQKYLNITTHSLEKTFERLSSGVRINSASDDAAGLAIADQLLCQSRVSTVSIRNANDGISIINIINSVADEMSNILTRISELAEQSANGVLGTKQREALQNEYVSLATEIQRIVMTTQFNGKLLLTGGDSIALQVGFDGGSNSQIEIPGMDLTLMSLGLATDPAGTNLVFTLLDDALFPAQENSRQALDGFRDAQNTINTLRGVIGSIASRLAVTVSNLGTSRENYMSAETQIRDVDVASEAAEMMKRSIQQQASTSLLTQINQQPGLALKLLA